MTNKQNLAPQVLNWPCLWGRWWAAGPVRSRWTSTRCPPAGTPPAPGWTWCGWTAAAASRWCSWCTAARTSSTETTTSRYYKPLYLTRTRKTFLFAAYTEHKVLVSVKYIKLQMYFEYFELLSKNSIVFEVGLSYKTTRQHSKRYVQFVWLLIRTHFRCIIILLYGCICI